MKKITINKKEYTLEYTIEASLYNDCSMAVMDTFVKSGMVQEAAEENNVNDTMQNLLETIADMPSKALTLFYAGLLEHHGPEGDGRVQGIADAKKLLAEYLKEKKKSFRDVFTEMIDLMAKDNFFDLIGLTGMVKEMEKETPSTETGKDTSEK